MQRLLVWDVERVAVRVVDWAPSRGMVRVVVGVVSVPQCVLWVKGGQMKQAGHWIAFITVYGGDDGSPGRGYCPTTTSLEWHVSPPHSTLSLLTKSLQLPHAVYITRCTLPPSHHNLCISFVFSISLTLSLTLTLVHLTHTFRPTKGSVTYSYFYFSWDNEILHNKQISILAV